MGCPGKVFPGRIHLKNHQNKSIFRSPAYAHLDENIGKLHLQCIESISQVSKLLAVELAVTNKFWNIRKYVLASKLSVNVQQCLAFGVLYSLPGSVGQFSCLSSKPGLSPSLWARNLITRHCCCCQRCPPPPSCILGGQKHVRALKYAHYAYYAVSGFNMINSPMEMLRSLS